MSDDHHDHSPGTLSNAAGAPLANAIPILTTGEPTLNPGANIPPSITIDPNHIPIANFHLCNIDLKPGCYVINYSQAVFRNFQGTMRVENTPVGTVISGDLYRIPFGIVNPGNLTNLSPAAGGVPNTDLTAAAIAAGAITIVQPGILALLPQIPIFARASYNSYLKVTNIKKSPQFTNGACNLILACEEFFYTQPPAGSFNGSFPVAPSRTIQLVLSPSTPPAGSSGPSFSGQLVEAGVNKGGFSMNWIAPFFRQATVEIDTLTGATQPPTSVGGENFSTVFNTVGWQVSAVFDQTGIAVPPGITSTNCWLDGDLHALMTANIKASTNLDKEWRIHVISVPAKMGCGRGVMYDSIGVPRQGVATFSDDGYPTTQSSNFGTAANKLQKNVPRAFLRSVSHEIGHGFNQIHQENEGGADNSIMTTTPSVADVLGGPATGAAGVFPDNINLGFNSHCRHHLIHWPDPVVRPGGMSFGTGHGGASIPMADRFQYPIADLKLELELPERLKLGEPAHLKYRLINGSKNPINVPSQITPRSQYAHVFVTGPTGERREMRSIAVQTDNNRIRALKPGEKLEGAATVFWSNSGFAFRRPGQHDVDLEITWVDSGVSCGIEASAHVFVDYPINDEDNDVAAKMMHEEVGLLVQLGGAPHLRQAHARIRYVQTKCASHQVAKSMAAYLPKSKKP